MTDRVIEINKYIETAGDVLINITKTQVERTKNGKTFRVDIIDKQFVGPAGPVARLQWKKYDKEQCKAIVGEEVFVETVHRSAKTYDKQSNDYIEYVELAIADKWSEEEIRAIKVSKLPGDVWKRLFRAKFDALAPTPVSLDNIVGVKLGLKARIGQQKNAREVDTSGPKPKGFSLSDKMRIKKEQSQDSEQNCTLFLDNVPISYTTQDIKNELAEFIVIRANVVTEKNESKQSTGRAFVVLNSVEEMQECMAYINTQCRWEHYVVKATLAKPKIL